jgi:hypothetical protein
VVRKGLVAAGLEGKGVAAEAGVIGVDGGEDAVPIFAGSTSVGIY